MRRSRGQILSLSATKCKPDAQAMVRPRVILPERLEFVTSMRLA